MECSIDTGRRYPAMTLVLVTLLSLCIVGASLKGEGNLGEQYLISFYNLS